MIYEAYGMAFDHHPSAKIEVLKRLIGDIVRHWNIPPEPQHVLGHCRVHDNPHPEPVIILTREYNGAPTRKAIFPRSLTRSVRSLKRLQGVWRQSATASERLREVFGGFAPNSATYQC